MDNQFTVIQNLKPITRISKSRLKNMLDIFKTSTRKIEKIDSSACNSCEIKNKYSLHKNGLDAFCSNCTKIKTFTEFSYVIEKETAKGTIEIITNKNKSIHLSKAAIKQFIAYHFIPCNKNLVRKSVSFRNIADICNISVVTARYNHSILVETGLVYSTETKRGKFDIVIDGEYKNHIKKSEGGEGYLTISLDTLKHLLKFENVNELKLEIKKLLWVDVNTSKLGKKVKFNKDNLISVLPDYIKKSSKRLESFLRHSKTLFDIRDNKIDTSGYETKEKVRSRYIKFIKEKIVKFFNKTGCSLSANYSKILEQVNWDEHKSFEDDLNRKLELEKEIIVSDLVGLSIQYSTNRVLRTLSYLFNEYTVDEKNINYNEVKNPGAFIRTIITENINRNGSLRIVI